jgi:ABC-type polysaccharide/polyol phosphate export permease
MLQNKKASKKAIRFALHLYSILIGLASTVCFIIAIFFVIPKVDLPYIITPLIIMAAVIYGTCAIALLIRAIYFSKERINNEQEQ